MVEKGPKRVRTDVHHWVMPSAMPSLVTLEQTPERKTSSKVGRPRKGIDFACGFGIDRHSQDIWSCIGIVIDLMQMMEDRVGWRNFIEAYFWHSSRESTPRRCVWH